MTRLERWCGSAAALDRVDRGVGLGGKVGVGEVDRRGELDVEVVGGVDPGAQRAGRARAEDVAAAATGGVDEVQVVAGDLDALDVGGEAEADHRALDVVELEDVLVGDDLSERAVRRLLGGGRAGGRPPEAGHRGAPEGGPAPPGPPPGGPPE